MKKVILMALSAGLFFLSGCKKDDSVNGGGSSSDKGAVIVSLETSGLASDIISVEISINDQVVKTLDKNTKQFKTEFDIQNEVKVKIQPKFASVTAPTDKFDFGYTYSYQIGTTSDGGTSWSKEKHDSATKSLNGAKPENFESIISNAKSDMKTVEASFNYGMLGSYIAHGSN